MYRQLAVHNAPCTPRHSLTKFHEGLHLSNSRHCLHLSKTLQPAHEQTQLSICFSSKYCLAIRSHFSVVLRVASGTRFMSSLSIEASSTDANRKIFFGGASMISSSKANSNEGLAISKKKRAKRRS